MRLAYVTSQIPCRSELSPGPIDAEWIVSERGAIDITVFADFSSDGADLVTDAGLPVHISPKRPVFIEGALETAEQIQARTMLRLHIEDPFDAVVYDSSVTADWAWHQPRLESIPRGVALGAGPIRDIRLVSAAPALFRTHGRHLWTTSGSLASADFLLGDAPPEAYGFRTGPLPPRYRLNALPDPAPAGNSPALVAVVALNEDPAGLASLVERAGEAAPIGASTILAVIHPDVATGPETTRDIVVGSLPPHLADRVRLAEPSSDGVAAGLLAQADFVVAARTSDLAIPAVREAVGRAGGAVIESTRDGATSFGSAGLEKRPHTGPALLPVDRPLADLVEVIDNVTAPAVVLHSREAADLARRVWRLPGSSQAGLVLVCDTDPYLGSVDPARPAFNVLGFRMDSWPSVRRLLEQASTLHELVSWVAGLSHAPRIDLLALPVNGASHGSLAPTSAGIPAWATDRGMLPPANFAGLSVVAAVERIVQHELPGSDIQQWAETHGFRDRVRLALPWKWGLLARAMRGRW
ncbi:MAG: hypothetical protein HKO82_01930 [Acidimicrobiia bacterium]|nr:hypothetical protein [Acidimicrobiia bacterium]